MDYTAITTDDFIVIDCQRILDPNTFTGVYNDSLKIISTAIKRQWGQKLNEI